MEYLTPTNLASLILTYVFGVMYLALPIVLTIFLKYYQPKLEKLKHKDFSGTIHSEIKLNTLALQYNSVITLRRLLFSVNVVYLSQGGYRQILLNQMLGSMVITYILVAKPFHFMRQNYFEIWSEAVLLSLNYLMMVFLNPTVKEESQFYAGVAFASIIFIYFLVNAILLSQQLYRSLRMIYLYIKMKRIKAKVYSNVANQSSKFSSRDVTPDISSIQIRKNSDLPFEKQSARLATTSQYTLQTQGDGVDTHRHFNSNRKFMNNESAGFRDTYQQRQLADDLAKQNLQKNIFLQNELEDIEEIGFDEHNNRNNDVTVWDVTINNQQIPQGTVFSPTKKPLVESRQHKIYKLQRHPEFM